MNRSKNVFSQKKNNTNTTRPYDPNLEDELKRLDSLWAEATLERREEAIAGLRDDLREIIDELEHRPLLNVLLVDEYIQFKSGKSEARQSTLTASAQVPVLGEAILFYLCPAEQLESILGDLEECFQRRAIKRGLGSAWRWYYWQVLRSAGAFALNLLGRMALVKELIDRLGF
ncbi:hypothetical protein [Rhodospirillaceae bacterium SYSU D60014]|uniref:hypothetical protein n=1 Tax=Virgifigura deserti TaxID=2268457 RepID=UPI0013C4E754